MRAAQAGGAVADAAQEFDVGKAVGRRPRARHRHVQRVGQEAGGAAARRAHPAGRQPGRVAPVPAAAAVVPVEEPKKVAKKGKKDL